jgi:putative salt-induced outer membrane protein YdiY
LAGVGVLLLLSVAPAVAQKTDVIVLINGDRVTGKIEELERGRLRVDTRFVGIVSINWRRVASVRTDLLFEVELSSGERFLSTIGASETDGLVMIDRGSGPEDVPRLSVVRLVPLRPSFWSRLRGSVDVGVSFLSQNTRLDYTLGGKAEYRGANYNVMLTANSLLRLQDNSSNVNRQDLSLAYRQNFGTRWFWSAWVATQANSELNLDLRNTLAGGAGRYFVNTNRWRLSTGIGLGYSRERYSDRPARSSTTAILINRLDFFNYGARDTDISLGLDLLPVVSESDRLRFEGDLDGRHEILADFFIRLRVFSSFDSRPPTEGATRRSDFGVTTSLGWTFN